MTRTLSCIFSSHLTHCPIEIGFSHLDHLQQLLPSLGSKFALITDDQVAGLYGEKLTKQLKDLGFNAHLFSFDSGEKNKTRATKEALENQLLERGFGRDSALIALGGGVVTDLAGFIAANYCRGIALIMIPTSLLAMVDACIGGKNGVNTPFGKNTLGSIYQPKKIIIDLSFLSSLSEKTLAEGSVEIIKHSLIADSKLFEYLNSHADLFFALDPETLERIIIDSCQIKKEIVEQDEKDKGKRALLNFGHTVGHALETLTNYSLSHGEAVAIGILVESYLSLIDGFLDQNSFKKIKEVLKKYKQPLQLPRPFSYEEFFNALTFDKKSLSGKPRFVLIKEVGSPLDCEGTYAKSLDESLLRNAVDWMNNELLGN